MCLCTLLQCLMSLQGTSTSLIERQRISGYALCLQRCSCKLAITLILLTQSSCVYVALSSHFIIKLVGDLSLAAAEHPTFKKMDEKKNYSNMSRVMRNPTFCICENKDADQLRGNREADQHLCFRYMDSTIPLLPQSEISSL